MKFTPQELTTEAFKEVKAVYHVFQDYFKEENVDLQNLVSNFNLQSLFSCYWDEKEEVYNIDSGAKIREHFPGNIDKCPFILVHWDKVKVTNENGNSIEIQDLFAKVPVSYKGLIPLESEGFRLNRSTFPYTQFQNGYLHSHTRILNISDTPKFLSPCLGHGPILNTIANLKIYSNDIKLIWMLFCKELESYVQVESLAGVPYIKMSQVQAGNQGYTSKVLLYFNRNLVDGALVQLMLSGKYFLPALADSEDSRTVLKDFIKYYLKYGNLVFDYNYGFYDLTSDPYDYCIDISRCFIDFHNSNPSRFLGLESLIKARVLKKVRIQNREFFTSYIDPDRPFDSNPFVCTFKGKRICRKIIKDSAYNANAPILILHEYLQLIIRRMIIFIINYKSNKNERNTKPGHTDPSTAVEKVYYL